MRIVFTGHRDKWAKPDALRALHLQFPNATWIHGGAQGFDMQVDEYAEDHSIPCETFRPDYERYPPKVAPLRRNDLMLEEADLLVACYDGRQWGGTYYTVKKARERGIPIRVLEPMKEEK